VNAKKVILLAVVALLVFYLITQPTQSASAVHTVLGWLRSGADAIITFVKSLFA
jgi:cell shape-determining protein MreC